jgi:hypothetical protein
LPLFLPSTEAFSAGGLAYPKDGNKLIWVQAGLAVATAIVVMQVTRTVSATILMVCICRSWGLHISCKAANERTPVSKVLRAARPKLAVCPMHNSQEDSLIEGQVAWQHSILSVFHKNTLKLLVEEIRVPWLLSLFSKDTLTLSVGKTDCHCNLMP